MGTLMVSVSGIRGIVGDGLDPTILVKYVSAYADFCGNGKIVIGRDSRITGSMVEDIVVGTLLAKGNDVIKIGVCPTPTVLFNVRELSAVGGIAISASHNPNQWNALKLLNRKGEFLTPDENKQMMEKLDPTGSTFKPWDEIGTATSYEEGLSNHLKAVLKMKYIDHKAIKERKFKVLLDCVNGAGSWVMPDLLKKFGCKVTMVNCEKTGVFPRLPEPVPENLTETIKVVEEGDFDLGIIVDPDVDRLVLLTEKGEPFVEEYTIAQAVKFILSKVKGNVVVNLSTTRAIDDIVKEMGCEIFRSAVGEANVVKLMKETDAVIGGEGSGGVIYPALQYGRDALVGTSIILQHLLEFGGTMSELKASLPDYFIAKRKISIGGSNPDTILEKMKEKYKDFNFNDTDGLRLDFEDHWVHLRKSNTEPIIRCIAESKDEKYSAEIADKYLQEIKDLSG